ncbi:uncharacterized protein CEXT_129691 [Caerostris extrusa]|uniref:Uncharacterized protein n=1 Tax=Caerostris extrusa TaxID=172846 RepID=A0AAV4N352_CAEEX|nr:uncharacterized protein CEXT_129691 [Caerostris extrusa]
MLVSWAAWYPYGFDKLTTKTRISNTLPNATSEMLVAHLGLSLEEEDRRLSISFSYRLLGFVCGYICGGVAFDYFILPMEQQALFSFMVIVLAFINGAIPFIINIVRLGIVLFLSGLIMSFITTGLVAYALALYGINSHTCLQFIYALNQLGEVATKLAVRLDYENIQIESHIALSYETKKEIFNKVIISFSCLTIATIFMAVTWICLYRFSPPEFKTDVPFDENRQRKASSIGFQALAVVTTLPLLINANFFSSVYDYLLSLHISKRLNRVVSVHDNILHLYFGCSVIGKYIAVGLAYK